MTRILFALLRLLITIAVVCLALIVGWRLYAAYELAPWTRDGKLRADIVQLAPDVSGLVTQVMVRDNEHVAAGQVLFLIDPARYQLALSQAQHAIAQQQILIDQAQRDDRRNRSLGTLVPAETMEQSAAKLAALQAALVGMQDAESLARLNLDRATVRAPDAGTLVDLDLDPGAYAAAGKPIAALVADGSLYVEGYFEETKLPRIRFGDRVEVKLMGETGLIKGHVTGMSAGITDRERGPSANLLPDVNPSFSWVRLAQRVPVRIAIDQVPPGVALIAGRTASVTVLAKRPLPRWQDLLHQLTGARRS